MATVVDGAIRHQLEDRRRKLQALAGGDRMGYLEDLLVEVDAALARMDGGTFGICEVCKDSVEADRLLADPLCRVCLDHLSAEERRMLEHDLVMAGRIQAALLPQPDMAFEGWEVHRHYEAVGPVSGDYCDIVQGDAADGALVAFGDVSGKGVSASILMASLHATLRSLVGLKLRLPELVGRANRIFCESTLSNTFATLVCGRFRSDGQVELANAGHSPPLLRRGGGLERIPPTGLPVGLFCTAEYATQKVEMGPGDVLLLYTDGLAEARNPSAEEYGLERIGRVLESGRGRSARALTEGLLADLARFQAGTPRADDLTVMTLARRQE